MGDDATPARGVDQGPGRASGGKPAMRGDAATGGEAVGPASAEWSSPGGVALRAKHGGATAGPSGGGRQKTLGEGAGATAVQGGDGAGEPTMQGSKPSTRAAATLGAGGVEGGMGASGGTAPGVVEPEARGVPGSEGAVTASGFPPLGCSCKTETSSLILLRSSKCCRTCDCSRCDIRSRSTCSTAEAFSRRLDDGPLSVRSSCTPSNSNGIRPTVLMRPRRPWLWLSAQVELTLERQESVPALTLLFLLMERPCECERPRKSLNIMAGGVSSMESGVSSGQVWCTSGSFSSFTSLWIERFLGCSIITPAKLPMTPSTKSSMESHLKCLNSSKKTPPVMIVKHDQFTWQSGMTN
mmetsp:Transcript_69857/g.185690  ORF Transcript_69857/g.185690 Transcript_69857/m.185690 type:complete len:354 (-) Transcript_69857:481-1542(-)